MSALKDRIGVSTLCLRGMDLDEAIERTIEAGFSTFEITPITYGGPEAFSEADCSALREKLSAFGLVTVHSSGMGNICSDDASERDLARARYVDMLRFAETIGGGVVTFHPGQVEQGSTKETEHADNVSFGKDLLDAANMDLLTLGYELFDPRVAKEIGDPSFGVIFDVGHASRLSMETDTDDVINLIDELADQVVQFHIHGMGEENKRDHLPFSENRWLDYGRIMKRIAPLPVPFILEIGIRSEDGVQNLKDCVAARDEMVAAVR